MQIKVVETRTWIYEPELDADFYAEHGIKTIEEAMVIDSKEVSANKVALDELGDEPQSVDYAWSIVSE